MPNPDKWTDPDATCEHCHRLATEWPAGLVCVDREPGMFGGDFLSCPACTPETTFGVNGLSGMILNGVTFAYINWYWWDGPTGGE